MAIDPSHPSPRFHNRGLYLAAMLERHHGLGPKQLFAVVQLPQMLPRFVPLGPADEPNFILLEEAVAARLPELFGGFDVLHWTTFRITRDSDIELLEQESDDMLRLIEERLKARQRGDAVRLEVAAGANEELVRKIIDEESLRDAIESSADRYSEVYRIPGPLDLTGLMELTQVPNRDHLRDPPFSPQPPRGLRSRRGDDLFAAIAERDILLHHPYDSFDPVVEFVSQRGQRPQGAGHQADAVSHQRRFADHAGADASGRKRQARDGAGRAEGPLRRRANNVSWARQMERAGVHVVFGFLDLKTHCKLSLVVRQEGNTLRRYVHLGTGNYNPTTALVYTDFGLFTADEDIGDDASALFNLLTGYSQGHHWRKLVVAPERPAPPHDRADRRANRAGHARASRRGSSPSSMRWSTIA